MINWLALPFSLKCYFWLINELTYNCNNEMKAHEDLLGISTYPMAPVSHWWSLDRSSRNLLCSTLPPHCLGYFLCVPGALELTLPLVIIFEEDNNASQVMLPPVLIASRPISKVRSHRRLERDCNFNTNYNVKLGRRQFVHQNNYEVSFLSYCVSVKSMCEVLLRGSGEEMKMISMSEVFGKYT